MPSPQPMLAQKTSHESLFEISNNPYSPAVSPEKTEWRIRKGESPCRDRLARI